MENRTNYSRHQLRYYSYFFHHSNEPIRCLFQVYGHLVKITLIYFSGIQEFKTYIGRRLIPFSKLPKELPFFINIFEYQIKIQSCVIFWTTFASLSSNFHLVASCTFQSFSFIVFVYNPCFSCLSLYLRSSLFRFSVHTFTFFCIYRLPLS